MLLGTVGGLVVSLVGLIWPNSRKWAIAGVVLSALPILWFVFTLVSVFTHMR